MTLKKLTVAAAIAVGIATCSFSTAMAACPCSERPIVTQDACPSEEIPVVTGNMDETIIVTYSPKTYPIIP